MATYKFDNINNNADIVDPVVTYPNLLSWNRDTKDGIVQALLVTPNGSKFYVELLVNLPTVNGGTMDAQGALALKEFEV